MACVSSWKKIVAAFGFICVLHACVVVVGCVGQLCDLYYIFSSDSVGILHTNTSAQTNEQKRTDQHTKAINNVLQWNQFNRMTEHENEIFKFTFTHIKLKTSSSILNKALKAYTHIFAV